MPSSSGPNNVNDSIIFNYDIGDVKNSFLGRPTSNVLAGAGMSTYNNVPGSVSSNLYTTGETYRGAAVYRQDLTALDGSGASWLSGCNNPGIGVVTGGGGGTGGVYTGHSIFFKPNVPMCSTPIYLHYSNIGGWQSCCTPPEDMGDGWFRAYVLWYDTVTRSDGKYWAINPASTAVGQTATIYWAGPFREDLNSTTISQFVNGSRSTSQSVLDIATGKTITVNNNPFSTPAINPQLTFDGIDDYVDVTSDLGVLDQYTIEHVSFKGSENRMPISYRGGPVFYQYGDNSWYYTHGGVAGEYYYPKSFNINGWGHWTIVYNGSAVRIYRNGVYEGQQATSGTANWTNGMRIGSYTSSGGYNWNGQIAVVKMYSRALTDSEVRQNYLNYKTRFNLQ
jgi:hypothetical protein